MSRSMGHNCNLKVYKYPIENMTPILTTIGEFLDKCDKNVRADIIERLIKVQTEEDTKNYKIIDENELEEVKEEIKKSVNVKLLNVWMLQIFYFIKIKSCNNITFFSSIYRNNCITSHITKITFPNIQQLYIYTFFDFFFNFF